MTVPGGAWLRFSRFSAIGLLGCGLQVLLFHVLLRGLHLPGVAAAAIAVEIVLLHNFLWHERFTWRDRRTAGRWQRARRLWRFHAANGLVSLAGNTVLIYWLVERFRLLPILSSLIAIATCALFNFLLADRCVFVDLLHGQSISTRGLSLPRYLYVVSLLRLGWKRVTDVRAGSLDLRRGAVRVMVAGINGKGRNERS